MPPQERCSKCETGIAETTCAGDCGNVLCPDCGVEEFELTFCDNACYLRWVASEMDKRNEYQLDEYRLSKI